MMVDMAQNSTTSEEQSNVKLKSLMGKTPGILKSKFLKVLGSSNEIINDFSNKVIYLQKFNS